MWTVVIHTGTATVTVFHGFESHTEAMKWAAFYYPRYTYYVARAIPVDREQLPFFNIIKAWSQKFLT